MALCGRPGSVKVRKVRVREGETIASSLKEVMKYSITSESLKNVSGKLSLLLDELSLTRNLIAFGSAYHHEALRKTSRSQPNSILRDIGEI